MSTKESVEIMKEAEFGFFVLVDKNFNSTILTNVVPKMEGVKIKKESATLGEIESALYHAIEDIKKTKIINNLMRVMEIRDKIKEQGLVIPQVNPAALKGLLK
jgi:hypothetical protein